MGSVLWRRPAGGKGWKALHTVRKQACCSNNHRGADATLQTRAVDHWASLHCRRWMRNRLSRPREPTCAARPGSP